MKKSRSLDLEVEMKRIILCGPQEGQTHAKETIHAKHLVYWTYGEATQKGLHSMILGLFFPQTVRVTVKVVSQNVEFQQRTLDKIPSIMGYS